MKEVEVDNNKPQIKLEKDVDFDRVLDYRSKYRAQYPHKYYRKSGRGFKDEKEKVVVDDVTPASASSATASPHTALSTDSTNSVANMMEQQRKKDPTAKVRWMCNQFKSSIICDAVQRGMSVLDLCCGSGGDLRKFSARQISLYLGIDRSQNSLDEAKRRCFTSGMHTYPGKENTKFERMILGDPKISIDFHRKFDVVSIQMALAHLSLANILPLVAQSLEDDGVFICTLFDSRRLPLQGIKNHPFASLTPILNPKTKKMTEYKYQFEGLFSEPVKEKVVEHDTLMKLCEQNGLVLEKEYRFDEIMESRIKHRNTQQGFPVLDPADQQILDLYCGYIFRKKVAHPTTLSSSSSSSSASASASQHPRVSSCMMTVQPKPRSLLRSI
jgi:SAM-dependent methyltransferase